MCLQFPTQSSLLRSQVGSLGSLSVWSQSNCEGGRSSTLQVYALCRAKAWLEQLHKGCAATKFKDVSIFFQEDNSKCQSMSCSLKIQLPQSSRASKQTTISLFPNRFSINVLLWSVEQLSKSPKVCTMHETGMLFFFYVMITTLACEQMCVFVLRCLRWSCSFTPRSKFNASLSAYLHQCLQSLRQWWTISQLNVGIHVY